ncbi:glycosyl hydrolase family 28-related protein, partial [Spirosoma humi]
VNVKDFGAKGDGSTDDTQAILNAIKATPTGATLYLPSGTYIVTNTLYLKDNLRMKGDGPGNTFIRCGANFSSGSYGLLYMQNLTNLEVRDLALEGNRTYRGNYSVPIYGRAATQLRLTNLKLNFPGYDPLDLHLSKYVFLTNCEIIGKLTFLGNCSQLFIDQCHFKMTNDTELALHSWGGLGVSLTNSSCEDLDNKNPNDGAGWGQGRFFVGNGAWGGMRATYIGGNTTRDLAPRPTGVDQNTGEQLLWEGMSTDWTGTASASTPLTTTLNGLAGHISNPDYLRYAVIIKGKGLGQSRRIVGYNGESITLEKAWNVPPDGQSWISIGRYLDQVVVYNNQLDGKQAAVESVAHRASAGIEPFGGVFNFIADNNTIQETRYGLANWALEHSGQLDPNYFSFYANNKLINCRWGINNSLRMANANTVGMGILGTIYRRNEITAARQSGILNSVGTSNLPVCNSLVFEYNRITGVTNGFSTGGDVGLDGYPTTGKEIENQVFYKNTIAGSTGYGIKMTPKIALRENSISGFPTTYNGSLLVLEAPYHVIDMNGQAGAGISQSALTIWNSGVNSMAWTASSNVSWLTLSATSGTIQDQNGSTTLDLSANPNVLPTGTYRATITVTAGDKTRAYTVIFNVTNNSSQIPPAVNLTSPSANSVRLAPTTITITATATDTDGSISKVEFYAGSTKVGEDTNSPYSFAWTTSTAGSYDLTAKAFDNNGLSSTSGKVTVIINATPVSTCPGTGSINWYYWLNLPEGGIANVPFDRPANGSKQLATFASPVNMADSYGSRARGYVCPPADGDYVFYIAGDDQAELYLSTNDNPANKQKIAWADYTCNGQYDKFPYQQSAVIQLRAGQRYYIEALQADGSSGDYLMVGWKLPNGVLQRPINGAHLIPFELVTSPLAAPSCSGTGSITWSYWANRSPWDAISNIPVNTNPTETRQLTSFASPTNLTDYYSSRARGYICPPTDGGYVFYIAGDDQAELYLSTSDDPANKQKIAWADYTCEGQYDKFPYQQSTVIQLKAGQRYYIEALHIEGAGGDYFKVGWKLPDGTSQRPIPGTNLIPYISSGSRMGANENFEEFTNDGLNAYPNPFQTKTTLEFTLPESRDGLIQVLDMKGMLIETIQTGILEGGKKYQYEFDGSRYTSGMYLCKLICGNKIMTKKLILIK